MKGPIDDEKLNQLSESLSRHAGKPVWFATDVTNPAAVALQRQLEDLFQVAGWEVRGNTPIRFRYKPQILFLTADARAPRYMLDAVTALQGAGLSVKVGTGYRKFAEQMKKKNPAWQGIILAPDQPFVIVIAPRE